MAFARAIILGFLFLAIGLAKNASAAAAPGDAPVAMAVEPDRDKPLGAGDTVSLEIVEDKTAPVLKRISDTGDLDVPYIGRVRAAGRSCADVAAEVTRKLEAKYYYHATVKLAIEQINTVKRGPTGKVLVSGYVKIIGPQEIPPGEKLTIGGAIVRAGSATQFGNLRKVKLIRKNSDGTSKVMTIDVKAILEEGKEDMELQDGDSINVPQKLFTT